jgi:hypothetical protein
MNRKLKLFGLMIAVLFAVSAVSAQAAFAAEEFHAHEEKVILTGEDHPNAGLEKQTTRVWVAGKEKGTVTCTTLEVWGTVQGTSSGNGLFTSPEATVHPKYSNCTSSFGSASVNTEECHYKFTASTDANGHAEVHIVCPAGQSIKISVAGLCTISVNNNQSVPGIHYTNVNTGGETSTEELTVHATTGKTIDYTSSGFGCSLAGIPSSGSEAEYEGTATVAAFEDISGTTTAPNNSYEDGEQVGIFKQ